MRIYWKKIVLNRNLIKTELQETYLIEFAPHLMLKQIDGVGNAMLQSNPITFGLQVHLNEITNCSSTVLVLALYQYAYNSCG